MSEPLQAVVFDRDGVLLELDQARLARDVLGLIPLSRAEIESRWESFLDGRALRDKESEQRVVEAFLASLAMELGLAPDARAALLRSDYTASVRAFPDARAALLCVRERGLRVGVLTNNTAAVSASRMLAAAGLEDLVDEALTSQMIGARKPEPRAFRAAAEALSVNVEACLFFDDAEASVEGARGAGMRAFHVDRARAAHDIPGGVVRDLTAVASILRGADGH